MYETYVLSLKVVQVTSVKLDVPYTPSKKKIPVFR